VKLKQFVYQIHCAGVELFCQQSMESSMPYLHIKISAGPSEEITHSIASTLTELVAKYLGRNKELTAMTVEYVQPNRWFIAGSSLDDHRKSSIYVEVKVTKGTNTKKDKTAFLEHAYAALEGTVGTLHPASYVVIQEVDADAWG
jgi:4-oxalocrotonate tautomerase